MHLLDLLTAMCIGPMLGVEFAVAAFIDPVVWQLGPVAEVRAIQMFAARLGRAMPFWYVGGLILLGAEVFKVRSPWMIAATAIWAATILFTLAMLVPINNRLAAAPSGMSAEVTVSDHKRWDRLHRLRVVALAASVLSFLVAIGR